MEGNHKHYSPPDLPPGPRFLPQRSAQERRSRWISPLTSRSVSAIWSKTGLRLPRRCQGTPGPWPKIGFVKTTLEIRDELLRRAKRHARRVVRPLRAILENGLRRVLAEHSSRSTYRLPDVSVGDPDADDPLEALSWQDLRAEIYGPPCSW